MKVVTLALKEKGLKISELPQELQQKIASLKELTDKYNDAVESYDETEEENKEVEAELDTMEDLIATSDKDVANEIKQYEPTPATPPAPATPESTEPEKEPEPEKKKDGGFGWLIFGGLVLVATVGAVNLLKKK